MPSTNYVSKSEVINAIEAGKSVFSYEVVSEIIQSTNLPISSKEEPLDMGSQLGGVKNISRIHYLVEVLNHIAARWRIAFLVNSPGPRASQLFKCFEKLEKHSRTLSELLSEFQINIDGTVDEKEIVKFRCQVALEEFPELELAEQNKFSKEHDQAWLNITPISEIRENIDELHRRSSLLKERWASYVKTGRGGARRSKDHASRLLLHMIISVYENVFGRKAATSTDPNNSGLAGGPLIRFSTEVLSRLGYDDLGPNAVRNRIRSVLEDPPEPIDYEMVFSKPISIWSDHLDSPL